MMEKKKAFIAERHLPSSILYPRLRLRRVFLPGAFGGLGDEAFFDGGGGDADVADFAVGQKRFDALEVGHEFALGDGGDVRTDTADFFGLT